jgi:hypothetical protein
MSLRNYRAQMLGRKCWGAIIERKCRSTSVGAQISGRKCRGAIISAHMLDAQMSLRNYRAQMLGRKYRGANVRCAYVRAQKSTRKYYPVLLKTLKFAI